MAGNYKGSKPKSADPELVCDIADLTQELICDLQEWWTARKPLSRVPAIFEKRGFKVDKASDVPKWCRLMWPPGAGKEDPDDDLAQKAIRIGWAKALVAIRQVDMHSAKALNVLGGLAVIISRLANATSSLKDRSKDLEKLRRQVDGEYMAALAERPQLAREVQEAHREHITGKLN